MHFARQLLAAALLLTSTCAWSQQAVEVPSLDRPAGRPVLLPGLWFAPAGDAPMPAIVLMHGCGGAFDARGQLNGRLRDTAARLNAIGVAALVTDSLTPRGEKELCTQRTGTRAVTQLQRRRDALGALQWLAAQPRVDARRLGLMGWSNGGSTVLAASNRQHREVAAAAVLPALAVAYYPGCAADLARGYEPVAPLLMLLGEADDWTPAAECKALAAGQQAVQFEAYPGAYHGFDGDGPVRLRKDVPNGANPGRGVHVGGQPEARAASGQRFEAFVREQFRLGPAR